MSVGSEERTHWLFLWIKFYWNTATHFKKYVVYGFCVLFMALVLQHPKGIVTEMTSLVKLNYLLSDSLQSKFADQSIGSEIKMYLGSNYVPSLISSVTWNKLFELSISYSSTSVDNKSYFMESLKTKWYNACKVYNVSDQKMVFFNTDGIILVFSFSYYNRKMDLNIRIRSNYNTCKMLSIMSGVQ